MHPTSFNPSEDSTSFGSRSYVTVQRFSSAHVAHSLSIRGLKRPVPLSCLQLVKYSDQFLWTGMSMPVVRRSLGLTEAQDSVAHVIFRRETWPDSAVHISRVRRLTREGI
jgi:hypothetical protein